MHYFDAIKAYHKYKDDVSCDILRNIWMAYVNTKIFFKYHASPGSNLMEGKYVISLS